MSKQPIFTDPRVVSQEEIDKAKEERKFIPDDIFSRVYGCMPISTSDFVLTRTNATGAREFLLGWRTEEPFKDTWFVPGGRWSWGEHPDDACRRHVKRELGVDVTWIIRAGLVNVMNPEGGGRPLWHSVWHLYEVPVAADIEIKPNKENGKVEWFTHIDPTFPDPVREALRLLGFEMKS